MQADTDREIQMYIQRDTILDITTHRVVELAQQMANSFMQWNKNSHHVDVDPAV